MRRTCGTCNKWLLSTNFSKESGFTLFVAWSYPDGGGRGGWWLGTGGPDPPGKSQVAIG